MLDKCSSVGLHLPVAAAAFAACCCPALHCSGAECAAEPWLRRPRAALQPQRRPHIWHDAILVVRQQRLGFSLPDPPVLGAVVSSALRLSCIVCPTWSYISVCAVWADCVPARHVQLHCQHLGQGQGGTNSQHTSVHHTVFVAGLRGLQLVGVQKCEPDHCIALDANQPGRPAAADAVLPCQTK